ncbi:MAG: HXXEE domain-containing protein, partial [Nitrososphaera sp.]|nr:HXXEE domain-containing protein [Nitrososphaera sp.]
MEKLLSSLVLIVIVGAHILEEVFASYNPSGDTRHLKGFRRFFNLEWFRTGKDNFPVTKLEALLKDQIGLFVTIALFVLVGTLNALFILVVVGFVTADLVQHAVFSIVRRQYTPGIATSALYFVYIVYFVLSELPRLQFGLGWTLGTMALGASFLALNYVIASWKVRKWRERQMPEFA